jgi:hypothetical protein
MYNRISCTPKLKDKKRNRNIQPIVKIALKITILPITQKYLFPSDSRLHSYIYRPESRFGLFVVVFDLALDWAIGQKMCATISFWSRTAADLNQAWLQCKQCKRITLNYLGLTYTCLGSGKIKAIWPANLYNIIMRSSFARYLRNIDCRFSHWTEKIIRVWPVRPLNGKRPSYLTIHIRHATDCLLTAFNNNIYLLSVKMPTPRFWNTFHFSE